MGYAVDLKPTASAYWFESSQRHFCVTDATGRHGCFKNNLFQVRVLSDALAGMRLAVACGACTSVALVRIQLLALALLVVVVTRFLGKE